MQTTETQVLIIGAGPVGLTMANELTRRGVACRIIDKNSAPTDKSKAVIVHARTLEVLDNMGLADKFIAAGLRGKGVSVWINGKPATSFAFSKINSAYPFPLLIEQSATEHLMVEHLAEQGRQVEREVELTDFSQDNTGITAILTHSDGTTEQVHCQYLVGCDGAHSAVRHKLNLSFDGEAYRNTAWLADVHLDWEGEPDYITNIMGKNESVVIVPMPGGHYRLIVVLLDDNEAESAGDPTLEQVQARIDMIKPGLMKLSEPRWLSAFHVHHRKVKQFSDGRVFLAGDAAHIHSPAGGQGMNTGIQDAHNLAWKMAQVLHGQAAPQILESYHAERNPIAEKVLKQTDLMFRAGSLNTPFLSEIRNHVIPIATSFGVVREKLQNMMLQLDINYRNSPFVSHTESISGELQSGDHAPDAPLSVVGQPQIQSAYDLFRHGDYTLLMLSGTHPTSQVQQKFSDLAAKISEQYRHSLQVCVVATDENAIALTGPRVRVGLDADSELQQKYEAKNPKLCLVRPDGYIAFLGQAHDEAKLEAFLAQALVAANQESSVLV